MDILFGLIAGLFGLYLFTKNKKNSAEALLENNKVTSETNKIDKDISKNDGLLESEEAKRKELTDNAEKQKQDVSQKTLLDFFNKH